MRSHCNPTRVKWAASTGLVGALVATAGLSVALAPNVGATAACVLVTDYTSSTSGSNTILTFTNAGTCEWTVPTGVTSVTLTLVGGGGGGGAGNGSISAPVPFGGGGGGGGEVRSSVSVSSLTAGQTVDITIGDGGLGGASAGTNGADGGQSAFGAATPEIAAPGKGGKAGDTANTKGGNGGAGGSAAAGGVGATTGSGFLNAGAGAGGGGGTYPGSAPNSTLKGGDGGYGSIVGSGTYGGGGGGGTRGGSSDSGGTTYFAEGGPGGGGNGATNRLVGAYPTYTYSGADATAGAANTGGGGGGGTGTGQSVAVDSRVYGANGGSGLVIVTFATPGGGGGGTPAPPAPAPPAPAPPAPAPEPSATATPTPTPTPTPTTSTTPTTGLDPIPNQVNPNVPASGVPQGGSVYLVDGTPAAVTVSPNAPSGATSLEVTGPDFFMKLSGVGDDSDPLGLTPKNALILQSRQTAARSAVLGVRSGRLAKCVLREPLAISSGNGFKANSPVKMYILPATYIGTLTADDTGAYQGSLPIPAGVLAGSGTLQANGFAPSGAVRSLSLGILVKRGRTVVTKSERANVFFDPMSPVISPEGKAKLDVLVKRATRNGVRTVSLGFVQETPTTSNDQSLSTLRARNVAAYLRSRGLAGAYVVRGDGIAGPGATARRVNVTVSYQTGC